MKALRPEQAFLILAILFGAGFLILNPPFQAPDEAFHLFRSWEISQGHWEDNTQNGLTQMEVPKSLLDFLNAFQPMLYHPQVKTSAQEILQFRKNPLEPALTQGSTFVSTVPHPLIPYLPQAAALFLGRAAGLSPFWLLYLGRLANFLLWLVLGYFAIKKSPIFQWTFALLALSPMSLYQSASLSPDALTNGLAFLLIAQVLRLTLLPEESAKASNVLKITTSAACLTLSKLVYLGHAGLPLLIPQDKYSSRSQRWATLAMLLALQIAILFWFFHGPAIGSRLETRSQAQWLFQHPLSYLGIVATTIRRLGWTLTKQFVGTFGHLDAPLPGSLVLLYLFIILIFALFDRGEARALRWCEKAWLLLIAAFEIGIIFTSIFVTWTHAGSPMIMGVQGRYFIPLAPLVLLPLYKSVGPGPSRKNLWCAFGFYFSVMTLTVSLFVLKHRFY